MIHSYVAVRLPLKSVRLLGRGCLVAGWLALATFLGRYRVSQFSEPAKVNRLDHHIPFSSGTGVRMRPTIRGTSKRGRPRGSRRGGPVGGKGRGLLLLHPPSKGVGSDPQSPASMSPTGSSATSEQILQHGEC